MHLLTVSQEYSANLTSGATLDLLTVSKEWEVHELNSRTEYTVLYSNLDKNRQPNI